MITKEELNGCMITGMKKAITEKYMKLTRLMIEMREPISDDEQINDYMIQLQNRIEELENKYNKTLQKDLYLYITIRPKETTIQKLHEMMKKLSEYKWAKNKMEWVYEQEGHTEATMGTGAHIHLLFNNNKGYWSSNDNGKRGTRINKTGMIKKLKEVCEMYNIDCKEPHVMEIPEKYLKDKRDYMYGLKTGENNAGISKLDCVKIDKLWRKKEKFENYYWGADKSGDPPVQ